MNIIYAKPLTCSKGLKIPFAITGHIYYLSKTVNELTLAILHQTEIQR